MDSLTVLVGLAHSGRMDAVEIRTRTGHPVAMLLPYPFPIAMFPQSESLVTLRQAASSFGFPYVFVVGFDQTRGWHASDGVPFFEAPTRELLEAYTTRPTELDKPWVDTLASLAGAWMADLQWRWKSKGQQAPGEAALGNAFLAVLRSDEIPSR